MRLKLLLSRCVVIAAFSSCSLSANDVLVTTTPVVIKDVAYDRAFPGKVSERKPVRVTALVDGILRQLVDEGDYVAQGDVVGRVESTDLAFRLVEANAAIEEERHQLLDLKNTLKSTEDLYKKKHVDDNFYESMAYSVERSKERLAQLTASRDLIKHLMTMQELKAPRNGVVTTTESFVGAYVNKGDSLLRLNTFDTLRVEVLVPVYLRDKIKTGDDVALTVNAVNGKGKVQSVFSDNPDDYGMLKVMVELTDIPASAVITGQDINATFTFVDPDSALVPFSAIVFKKQGSMVFKAVDGKSIQTPISLVRKVGSLALVTGELTEGEQIISAGAEFLDHMTPIKHRKAPAMANQE